MATTYQIAKLADTFKAAGEALNQRIENTQDDLSYDDLTTLTNKAQDLLTASESLYELATIQLEADSAAALDKLSSATDDLNKALKTVATVQAAISITAQLVGLAGSIITGNIGGIAVAAEGIVNAL